MSKKEYTDQYSFIQLYMVNQKGFIIYLQNEIMNSILYAQEIFILILCLVDIEIHSGCESVVSHSNKICSGCLEFIISKNALCSSVHKQFKRTGLRKVEWEEYPSFFQIK